MELKKRSVYPLGMFDLFKGFCMFAIVITHAIYGNEISPWIQYLFEIGGACFMGGFYAVNGFQFRLSVNVKQAVKKAAKTYLPTYFDIAFISLGLILFTNYSTIWNWTAAFLLGWLTPTHVESFTILYVALGWFLLALFWANILMNLILRIKNKFIRLICVVAIAVVGIYMETHNIYYYCICRGFRALPSMYVGYCMYSEDWLSTKKIVSNKILPYLLMIAIIPFCICFVVGPEWSIYLALICEPICGCAVIIFSRDTVDLSNAFLELIRKVGRYTPWIVVVHSVDIICFPWSEVSAFLQFITNNDLRFAVLVILRGILIFLGCLLYEKYDKLEKQWKRKRRAQRRVRRKVDVK